jgi:hypothetical protein
VRVPLLSSRQWLKCQGTVACSQVGLNFINVGPGPSAMRLQAVAGSTDLRLAGNRGA